MTKLSSVVTSVAAGLALAVAAVTYAQPPGGPGPGCGPGMGMGMGMGPGHGRMAGVDPATRVDSRLTYLKTQLQITTAQETAWQEFAATAIQQASSRQAARAQMWDSAGTAPERMALRAQMMQQRAASMTTMSNALTALYAVLTPEQKTIADQSFGRGGHRGMPFARPAG